MLKTKSIKNSHHKETIPAKLKLTPPERRKKISPCLNKECRLRIYGCSGEKGCPGYKSA